MALRKDTITDKKAAGATWDAFRLDWRHVNRRRDDNTEPLSRHRARHGIPLSALDLRDEEHFGARLQRLEIPHLMDLAVDGDGGLLLEVVA